MDIECFFEGESHDHHARDDHRSHGEFRGREYTDTESQGRGPRGGHRASSCQVVKLDPIMIEGMKAPLRQDGPGLGSLADGAAPPVRPGQRRRSLEVGQSRLSGCRPSWAGR